MLRKLLKAFRNPFNGARDKVSRSELVGMYLFQANHRGNFASEFFETRTRQNGKFSHKRERD